MCYNLLPPDFQIDHITPKMEKYTKLNAAIDNIIPDDLTKE